MKDFRDLKVWTKAHQLAIECYTLTSNFPKQEIFGIVSQIRRAASSIGANIAEGCGRSTSNGEFQRFLLIAMGSASELENHLLLAKDLRFLEEPSYRDIELRVIETKKMLAALIKKVEADRRQ
jgi:four helix bundle protein